MTTFFACLAAVTALALTPGPDTILVIRNCVRGGTLAGIATALGGGSGLFVHAALSAAGISLLLLNTAWAFTLLRYIGAAWLVWLGISSLWQIRSDTAGCDDFALAGRSPLSLLTGFREGLLCNILNPKVIVFYMAFISQFINPEYPLLPPKVIVFYMAFISQFINPEYPLLPQSMMVAALHFSVMILYLSGLSLCIDRSREVLEKRWIQRMFHGLCGTVLLFFGIHLLVEE